MGRGGGGTALGGGGPVVVTVERSQELPLRPCPCPFFAPQGPAGSWVGVPALDSAREQPTCKTQQGTYFFETGGTIPFILKLNLPM